MISYIKLIQLAIEAKSLGREDPVGAVMLKAFYQGPLSEALVETLSRDLPLHAYKMAVMECRKLVEENLHPKLYATADGKDLVEEASLRVYQDIQRSTDIETAKSEVELTITIINNKLQRQRCRS